MTAFNRVLQYFDPNRGKNYKTNVLDCSYSQMWTERDVKLFDIHSTKNLTGSILEKKFDIIVYEPPRNRTFDQNAVNSTKVFTRILQNSGIVIVKMNDFKDKGSRVLRGSFDIWDIFLNEGFYLQDNIIYNFHKPSNVCEVYDRTEIIHLYFMIFGKLIH